MKICTKDEIFKTKYWALEVITSGNKEDISSLSGSLTSSNIDLNPHQIQAALFALQSPISKGVILADEVGLGKTIEAGIILSEYISKGQTSLLVIAPASLTPQWQVELKEKFDLPVQILDRTIYKELKKQKANPFEFKGVTVCSYHFAVQLKPELQSSGWDLVVFDEAHKLRNLYKGKTKIADALYAIFKEKKKLLLTATPIQNTLMDIFSLVSMIDGNILGNEYAFMENYLYSTKKHNELKQRLKCVLHRTLRKDVLEYVRYTNREAMTVAFNPTPEEEDLYYLISDYIKKGSKFAITTRFRTLIVLMVRKLMSSSTSAIKGTLEGLRDRLIELQNNNNYDDDLLKIIRDADLVREYEEDIENYETPQSISLSKSDIKTDIQSEITYLNMLIDLATKIKVDGKTEKLIDSIDAGFRKIEENSGLRKAIIFTESQRTLNYLFEYLSKNGFKDKIVTFSGNNNSPLCNEIYSKYKEEHILDLTGSKTTDMKKALVHEFKSNAEIMIATEAAAEGLNLQFCSLLMNYDLPWNPQRIEQRIGRIHRYGQKSDVVIINFINKKNVADVRIYEILQNKFKLFDGVFGASDEILGTLSDGIDFEKAIAAIFEHCRTPAEIEKAFDELQASIGEKKDEEIEKTKQLVLENLTPNMQEKLHLIKDKVESYLTRNQEIFWNLTLNILKEFYSEYLVNETRKLFGPFEEQVFGTYSERHFEYNFSHILDYKRRDYLLLNDKEKKQLRLHPQPYNPKSSFGKTILDKAYNLEVYPAHLIIKGSKLPAGKKGRFKLSIHTTEAPTKTEHLIATFLEEQGGVLSVDTQDLFDHIVDVKEIANLGYKDLLNALHTQALDKHTKEQQKITEQLLKNTVEQLNRWMFDEKQSIQLSLEKTKNKIEQLKRQFKAEKVFKKKIELGEKIKKMEIAMNDADLNSFEKERSIEKKCKNLIGAKKRTLQYKCRIKDIFDCTFETI